MAIVLAAVDTLGGGEHGAFRILVLVLAALTFVADTRALIPHQEVLGGVPWVALVTAFVVLTGGADSSYAVLYLLVLVSDAALEDRRRLKLDLLLVATGWVGFAVLDPIFHHHVMLVELHDHGVQGATWGVVIMVVAGVSTRWREAMAAVLESRSELRASEQRFRSLFDNHPAGVHVGDREGRLVDANEALLQLTGLTREQLQAVGPGVLRRLVPSEEVQALDRARAVALGGRATAVTTVTRTTDGRERHLKRTYIPIEIDGEVAGVFGISEDITDQVRAEQQLRESEHRFRLVAELSRNVIYRFELLPEPHFAYVNDAATALTGFTPADFATDPMILLRHSSPDDEGGVGLVRERRDPGRVTFRFERPDGTTVWLEDHYTPVADDDGRVVAVQGIIVDVSAQVEEQTRIERALEEELAVGELRTMFLQAVSHELRTPLTSVLGFAELLERYDGVMDAGRQRYLLERLHANARRLRRLLNDLLDVDRLSRGTVELSCTPVDLAALARRVVRGLDPGDRTLVCDLQPVTVWGEASKLERVVENLVRNAIKHTPAGTTIWVRTGAGETTLVVEDDGPGIPTGYRETIFEPFRQGPDALHDPSPGTGIGLSLVARLAELHGGRAWAETRPEGGARFVVTLPRVEHPGLAPVPVDDLAS